MAALGLWMTVEEVEDTMLMDGGARALALMPGLLGPAAGDEPDEPLRGNGNVWRRPPVISSLGSVEDSESASGLIILRPG